MGARVIHITGVTDSGGDSQVEATTEAHGEVLGVVFSGEGIGASATLTVEVPVGPNAAENVLNVTDPADSLVYYPHVFAQDFNGGTMEVATGVNQGVRPILLGKPVVTIANANPGIPWFVRILLGD